MASASSNVAANPRGARAATWQRRDKTPCLALCSCRSTRTAPERCTRRGCSRTGRCDPPVRSCGRCTGTRRGCCCGSRDRSSRPTCCRGSCRVPSRRRCAAGSQRPPARRREPASAHCSAGRPHLPQDGSTCRRHTRRCLPNPFSSTLSKKPIPMRAGSSAYPQTPNPGAVRGRRTACRSRVRVSRAAGRRTPLPSRRRG